MSATPQPSTHGTLRVLIAGGGIAALEALLALTADAGPLVDVTLVADGDTFAYRSLQVGEAFGLGHPRRYPLAGLVEGAGAHFVQGSVAAVRPEAHELVLEDETALGYDALLLALGARYVPAFEHGTTFDPGSFDEILGDLRDRLAGDVTFVVPAGVRWTLPAYELALMTAEWNADADIAVRVVTHEAGPVEVFGPRASEVVADELERTGVTLAANVAADVPGDGLVHTSAHWLPASRVVSLAVPAGPRLRGVPGTESGYLPCDKHGRLQGAPDVWAAGDGTAYPIKQGGLAAQQADAAAADIARQAGARTRPRPFLPVLRGLLRTTHGPLYLRRALHGTDTGPNVSPEPLWWPPSKVASRRLAVHLARLDVGSITLPPPGDGLTVSGPG